MLCTLEDVVRRRRRCLNRRKRFHGSPSPPYGDHQHSPPYRLEPKRMKMVHPFADRDANMVMIEAVRGGGAFLKVEAPVIVFREPGVYADEIRDVYGY